MVSRENHRVCLGQRIFYQVPIFFRAPIFAAQKKLPTPEKLGIGSFLYPENFSFETSAMQPIDASI